MRIPFSVLRSRSSWGALALLLPVAAFSQTLGAAVPGTAAAVSERNAAPAADYYSLVLNWAPGFCETIPEDKSCRTMTAGRYDAEHLTLHGLWPDQKDRILDYCGVPEEVRKLDRFPTWCRMPPLGLSEETKAAAAVYMPGSLSCLEFHEWYKHGTCSGLDADAYFMTAFALVLEVGRTHFDGFISTHAGETVDSEDLFREFERDFGTGSRSSLVLHCAKDGNMLADVRIYLKGALRAGAPLADLLAQPGVPARNVCPRDIRIPKARFVGAQ